MERYNIDTESYMVLFFNSLNERDRRRYAAVESIKLGYGGISYISDIFEIDDKTINKGLEELKKHFRHRKN